MSANILTIPALLESTSSKNSTKILFSFADQTQLTFAVFYNRVEILSEFLRKYHIKKGDCIAVLDSQFINLPIIYFALAQIGAIIIPLIPNLSTDELEFILQQNKVVAIFAPLSKKEEISTIESPFLKYFINIVSFKFEPLQPDSATHRFEQEVNKIKRATIELVKQADFETQPNISEQDEIQRLILPDLNGDWDAYYYSQRHLLSASQMITNSLQLSAKDRILFLLPFYFNLTISMAILGPILKGYQVFFVKQPKNLSELEALIKKINPTHILIETSLFEKLVHPALLELLKPKLFKNTKQIFSFLTKFLGFKNHKLLKAANWIICCNIVPPSPLLNRFLMEHEIPHSYLFGTFETTSVLLKGTAQLETCWVKGTVIDRMEIKIDENNSQLFVDGPNVLKHDSSFETNNYVGLPVIAESDNMDLKILGFVSTVLKLPSGLKLDARLIEAALKHLPQIQESLCYQKNGNLYLKIVPTAEFLLQMDEKREQKLLAQIMQLLKEFFPPTLEITGIHFEKQPFPRTPLGQILRKIPL